MRAPQLEHHSFFLQIVVLIVVSLLHAAQTGVTPWNAGNVTPNLNKTISLSDIISANATPFPRRQRK
jgi:hypothetical protein